MQDLKGARIAIAGLGVGRSTLMELLRLGIAQFHLADDPSCAARYEGDLEELVEQARAINPNARVSCFPEGVRPENAQRFLEGVSIFMDHLDPECGKAKLILHQLARAANVPALCCSSLGFGASVVSFDGGTPSFAELSGLSLTASAQTNRERFLAFISPRKPGDLVCPEMPIMGFAGALGAAEVTKHLIGFGERVMAPDGLFLNSIDNKFERFKAYWQVRG